MVLRWWRVKNKHYLHSRTDQVLFHDWRVIKLCTVRIVYLFHIFTNSAKLVQPNKVSDSNRGFTTSGIPPPPLSIMSSVKYEWVKKNKHLRNVITVLLPINRVSWEEDAGVQQRTKNVRRKVRRDGGITFAQKLRRVVRAIIRRGKAIVCGWKRSEFNIDRRNAPNQQGACQLQIIVRK